MQSQFGVGLREAAHNLRICPTTLKRACRRHGIYRWPRRQSWGGGSGDAGRTESMNLDGDSVSSAGLHAGCDQPGVILPAQGSIAVCCNFSKLALAAKVQQQPQQQQQFLIVSRLARPGYCFAQAELNCAFEK